MTKVYYLIELFSHPTNNGSMFHTVLHFGSDFTFTSGSTDKELHNTS